MEEKAGDLPAFDCPASWSASFLAGLPLDLLSMFFRVTPVRTTMNMYHVHGCLCLLSKECGAVALQTINGFGILLHLSVGKDRHAACNYTVCNDVFVDTHGCSLSSVSLYGPATHYPLVLIRLQAKVFFLVLMEYIAMDSVRVRMCENIDNYGHSSDSSLSQFSSSILALFRSLSFSPSLPHSRSVILLLSLYLLSLSFVST